MKRRFPLHIHISTLFLILLLIVGSVIGGLGYTISRDILKSSANELSSRIGRETLREFTALISPAEIASRLLSLDGITRAGSLEQRLESLDFIREALNSSSELTSLYVGYGNGDFFLIRRIENDAERISFDAPKQTAYILQSIDHIQDRLRGRFIFLDRDLLTLRGVDRPDYANAYDPRTRDWYKIAQQTSSQVKTPPYVFHTTKQVGTTIANRARTAEAVVGADISLETLNRMLTQQKVTPGTHMLLVNRTGQILAHGDQELAMTLPLDSQGLPILATLSELDIPVLAQLAASIQGMDENLARNRVQQVGDQAWHVSVSPLILEGSNPLFLICAIPDNELMATAHTLMQHLFIAMALAILLAIPVTWSLARFISKPLRKLAEEADAIRHFDFSKPITVESPVLEVSELAMTMDSMKSTISRFLDISMAVAAENNFDRLLPHLLTETMSAADARAGVLYLSDDEKLLPATVLMADGRALPPSAPIQDSATGSPLLQSALVTGTARTARLTAADIDALGLAEAVNACNASHAIAVPLLNRQKILVGAMILLRHDETDAARLSFIGAISGSAAVSLETKALIRAQKMLFEALIRLIASAIDAKSVYTGGHCARVPELTKMLARAACEQTSGLYKDFNLSEDEWEAVHIAA